MLSCHTTVASSDFWKVTSCNDAGATQRSPPSLSLQNQFSRLVCTNTVACEHVFVSQILHWFTISQPICEVKTVVYITIRDNRPNTFQTCRYSKPGKQWTEWFTIIRKRITDFCRLSLILSWMNKFIILLLVYQDFSLDRHNIFYYGNSFKLLQ